LGNGVIYKLSPPTGRAELGPKASFTLSRVRVRRRLLPVGTPAFDSTGAIYGVTESGGI